MPILTKDSPIVEDARKLYFAFGGRQHRKIEAAMRAKGYESFSRRVLYDRLERGRRTPSWVKRFEWKTAVTKPIAGGQASHRSRPANSHFTPQNQNGPRRFFGLAERRAEIKAFEKWLKRTSPNMKWGWAHLKLLYRKLTDVTSGKTKRLMIFMPPRHGKSELVTVRYPAYRLRNDPKLNVIVASYNQKLANRFSRKIRITYEDSIQFDSPTQIKQLTAETQRRRELASNEFKQDVQDGQDIENKSDPVDPVQSVNLSSPRLGVSAVNGSRNRLNTVAEWETGLGGGVRAVGVGAGITGYGAKLVIIDDPIKSRSEAESETYRNKTWEWFNDDLYTRLEPDAAMILIQTRWHEDDLAGRLLEEMKNGGEKWEVVSLPAIAEDVSTAETQRRGEDEEVETGKMPDVGSTTIGAASAASSLSLTDLSPRLCVSAVQPISDPIGRRPGDALCPERFPVTELERIRRQLGEYSFAALYQQRPMPLEGGLFKKKWFTQFVDHAPAGLRWFRGYDLAISTKTSADFTASARVAMDRNGIIYVTDVFRARLEYPDQRKFVVDRLVNERDTEHGIEDALHAKAFIQDLRREPNLARCAIRLVSVTSDKFTRALAWANRAEEGKIILVRGPWLKTFLDEICSFPNSAHDDQTDAVSLAIQMMERRRRQFWRF